MSADSILLSIWSWEFASEVKIKAVNGNRVVGSSRDLGDDAFEDFEFTFENPSFRLQLLQHPSLLRCLSPEQYIAEDSIPNIQAFKRWCFHHASQWPLDMKIYFWVNPDIGFQIQMLSKVSSENEKPKDGYTSDGCMEIVTFSSIEEDVHPFQFQPKIDPEAPATKFEIDFERDEVFRDTYDLMLLIVFYLNEGLKSTGKLDENC